MSSDLEITHKRNLEDWREYFHHKAKYRLNGFESFSGPFSTSLVRSDSGGMRCTISSKHLGITIEEQGQMPKRTIDRAVDRMRRRLKLHRQHKPRSAPIRTLDANQ